MTINKSGVCMFAVIAVVLMVSLLGVCSAQSSSIKEVSVSFAKDAWNKADWLEIRTPYSKMHGVWEQNGDNISNKILPEGTIIIENKSEKEYEDFATMLYKQKLSGDVEVSSTMSWDEKQAPLIVFAEEPQKAEASLPFSRNYVEVVLYYKGINVWEHSYKDGKQGYKRLAWIESPFNAKTKYKLEIKIKGQELFIRVGDKTLGCLAEGLPKEFYAGITACEGVNRFYDFSIKSSSSK